MWWFKECTLGQIELGWMVPETGGLTGFQRFDLENEAVIPFIEHVNSVPGRNLYIRAATIDPLVPKGRTTDRNVAQAPGVWADLDTEEQVATARQVQSMIRANGWIITGRTPHPRYQLFFRTSEPLVNAETIRQFNQRLMRVYGGDPAVANPSRLMRLPGTIAWPYKPGRVPELTTFEEAPSDRPRAYPISTLASQLPSLEQHHEEFTGAGGTSGLSALSRLLSQIRAGQEWHNSIIKLIGHWVAKGRSDTEILLTAGGLTLPGWTIEQTRTEMEKAIVGARNKWQIPNVEDAFEEDEATEPYHATPFLAAHLSLVQPLDWAYRNLLVADYFSALGAPPGTGKTAFIVMVAVSIAIGRDLITGTKLEQRNVWIINLEDPKDHLLRLVWACCQFHNVEPVSLEGRLFIDSGRDQPLVVARWINNAPLRQPQAAELEFEMERRNVGVLFVDPIVDTHNLPENDNTAMNAYCAIWNGIAERRHAAVLLSHHFRKGAVGGDPDAFRGASAIIGKARSALTISVMSSAEAEKLNIDPKYRLWHLRFDNAKRNLSPPPTEAEWMRLESVDLTTGDSVQALRKWAPPSAFGEMSMADVIACIEAIDAGPGEGERSTATRRGRANARWAGGVLVEKFGKSIDQAQNIINQWLQSGVLIEGLYQSAGQRRELTCVRSDSKKIAEMRAHAGPPPETPWEGN